MRALIVEDYSSDLIEEFLREVGYKEVKQVRFAEEAIALFQGGDCTFDLVVTGYWFTLSGFTRSPVTGADLIVYILENKVPIHKVVLFTALSEWDRELQELYRKVGSRIYYLNRKDLKQFKSFIGSLNQKNE